MDGSPSTFSYFSEQQSETFIDLNVTTALPRPLQAVLSLKRLFCRVLRSAFICSPTYSERSLTSIQVTRARTTTSKIVHHVVLFCFVVTTMYRALVILLGAALVGAASASKCQRITAPICQDVGYNATAMPNKMGDENQEQAALQVR